MSFLPRDAISEFSEYEILSLPHSVLRVKSKGEYSSACPRCGGFDRLRFWPERGNLWCRGCGFRGFVRDAPQKKEPTYSEIVMNKITSATPEFERWVEYYSWLWDTPEAQEYWEKALGENYEKAVNQFGLGWNPNYHGLGPTATIPISYMNKVLLTKHRLITLQKGKYITEPSGVGAMIFNLDESLNSGRVVLVEGEKKAIRLWLEGYVAVSSTVGDRGWLPEWDLFLRRKKVYLIYDPDVAGKKGAQIIMKRLPEAENIVLPGKVDDLINEGFDISSVLGPPWVERI